MFYGRRALGAAIQPDPSYGVAVGDLDGDDALDLVVANDLALAPVYRNDGKGNFSQMALLGNYLEPQPRRAVALGDLDRDGDLDVVLTRRQFMLPEHRSPAGYWLFKHAPQVMR